MDWRQMVDDKLMSPQEAIQAVKPGDKVMVAPINGTPYTLCQALYDRRQELWGMRVDHPAALFPWVQPGEEGGFQLRALYESRLSTKLSAPKSSQERGRGRGFLAVK